ncbi:hypothetical protein B0H63DRAFT_519870 [Podospora didyma]|uniref:Uncharacterized protein n=1 Tax=Podospora didyma TaxID=330526 RepID=A0AAE0NZT4_9PEZI|nr:hypothetical protein B0H63DRAFT_519870 [Podospora didyma]
MNIVMGTHLAICNDLASFSNLPSPVGQLAGKLNLTISGLNASQLAAYSNGVACYDTPAFSLGFSSFTPGPGTATTASTAPGDAPDRIKFTRTAVIITLDLPPTPPGMGKVAGMDRDAAINFYCHGWNVTVITNVNADQKIVVNREPINTSGGEIKLWLSDFVTAPLPVQFIRPLLGENRSANIVIPYTTILEAVGHATETSPMRAAEGVLTLR